MILVTGSSGLVGRRVCERLAAAGRATRLFDLKRSSDQDVRSGAAVAHALEGVTGVLHLAAIARVIDGERNPELCRQVNVGGVKTVIDAALARMGAKPWFVFVSSREIYGDAAVSPTTEDSPYQPLNAYARTKVEGEQLTFAARGEGLIANVCRLSTVYGAVDDYEDRLLPAFCRAAAEGGDIRIDGNQVVVDPTHVDDVARGIERLCQETARGALLPPVHFTGGKGYSLPEIAALAVAAGDPRTRLRLAPPRSYDVTRFVGEPSRAKALLGWTAKISLEEGVTAFVDEFRERRAMSMRAPLTRAEARFAATP